MMRRGPRGFGGEREESKIGSKEMDMGVFNKFLGMYNTSVRYVEEEPCTEVKSCIFPNKKYVSDMTCTPLAGLDPAKNTVKDLTDTIEATVKTKFKGESYIRLWAYDPDRPD
jgi:hypothetical protein